MTNYDPKLPNFPEFKGKLQHDMPSKTQFIEGIELNVTNTWEHFKHFSSELHLSPIQNLCTQVCAQFGEEFVTRVNQLKVSLTDVQMMLAHSRVVTLIEKSHSLEDIAHRVELGQVVMVYLNSGILWNDASYVNDGSANYLCGVTGVARVSRTDNLYGFYLYDPIRGIDFYTTQQLTIMWLLTGGIQLVSENIMQIAK